MLACFAFFGPAQLAFQNGRWNLTARVTVTAFAENTLAELESYEKTLEMDLALDTTLPETADLYPECWLSVEDLQCTAQGGALEVTVTARVEGDDPGALHNSLRGEHCAGRTADSSRPGRSRCGSIMHRQGSSCLRSPGDSPSLQGRCWLPMTCPRAQRPLQRLADCWYPAGNICQTTRVLSVKTAQSPI